MRIYNCSETLMEALDSIAGQTYRDWEIIMCDDASSDNTLDIAHEFQKRFPEQVIVIKKPKNMGLNYTLNKCLEVSSGDYIARMDGDDVSKPTRFEREVKVLEQHPEIAIVSTDMEFFDEDGVWGRTHTNPAPTRESFIKSTPFCHAACMVRREAYIAVDGYSVEERLLRVEDYHLWIKMYEDDYVTLFFDYQNGSERVTALLKNLYGAMSDISSQLSRNAKVTMEDPFQSMLHLETETSEDGQEQKRVKINTSDLQKAIDEKGLYSIVSSEKMPSEDVYRRYASRNASETQYRFIKTQLGYGTLRVQNTQAVYAKFFTAFIASIIRFEIEQASKALGQSATRMIDEASRLEMVRLDNTYTYTHAEKARVTDLFSKLGVDGSTLLDETVKAENDRIAGRTPVLRHRKPGPKRGSHHKQYDSEGNTIRRKSGVKLGTKRPAVNQDGSARKKPGVVPGTKRGIYNKDGSLRKKPGPKSHNEVAAGQ